MSTSRARKEEALLSLIDETRSLFHLLRVVAAEVHGGSELTAGRRGVLMDLVNHGETTVPKLARARPVSRQHIQTLVNSLLADGLVELKPNPAHRRSSLVGLTEEGLRLAAAMRERESRALAELPLALPVERVLEAAAVLRGTREAFLSEGWRESVARG